ncbi:hypothetical protein COLO4_05771 [Corchorus olitorius]|uniref:KIB1-4 beta-propeller domain-containing protein n=1 Tax=Corchorus olitorius TaxID=93759 RepID=A0A1R3KPZ1_9ROSI|nr:hypothetical protein COLO4_05771 [Corchorus olitorius]
MSEIRDWAAIPCDLLRQIVGKSELLIDDYIRAAAVCRSWQACLKQPKFPVCLMLPENEDEDNNMRCFCTASEDKVMERELGELRGRRCWGTPFGWLVTFGLDLEIQLFNPLSRACVSLPSQPTFNTLNLDDGFAYPTPEGFRKFFLHKFAFSSTDPTSPDCVVMAIFTTRQVLLGFASPGDEAWTTIGDGSDAFALDDVTYFNGSFFAVSSLGLLLECQDLDGPSPKCVEFAKSPSYESDDNSVYPQQYIVDLNGHLCMILRMLGSYDIKNEAGEIQVEDVNVTEEFVIFKLDMQSRNWERMVSLGDRCLFLGNCCTFSVLATHYPGCTPNHIYYTDDDYANYEKCGGYDTGIYNFDEGLLLPLDGESDRFRSKFCPPLWIHPSSH